MTTSRPRTFVCAGGGGVGKTTTSAALGLALARAGKRTLVVTIDPARRLADALGVAIGPEPSVVHADPSAGDRLLALMPDPSASTTIFMDMLFHDDPAALVRLANNGLYQALLNALAGMHEVVCMALLHRAAEHAQYDAIVVDTAPSRYALDFVGYPARLSALLEGRALTFLAGLAAQRSTGGPLAWARRGVEAAIGKMLGTRLLVDLSGIFQEMAGVRAPFAELAGGCSALLSGENTRYLLVAAPTGSGLADARFLEGKLRRLNLPAHALLLNRADVSVPGFVAGLAGATDVHVRQAVEDLESERRARTDAANLVERELAQSHPGLPRIRLPLIAAEDPAEVVRRLSHELTPHLPLLNGN